MANFPQPLQILAHKDSIFEWTSSHKKAFERIKSEICKDTTLAYFNTNQHTTLQVDASGIGLGAVLLKIINPYATPHAHYEAQRDVMPTSSENYSLWYLGTKSFTITFLIAHSR